MEVSDASGKREERFPPWYDARRTANARVLLIGTGSLGSRVAAALPGKGFRRVLMVDPGTVGKDDIGHLAHIRESDIGSYRSEAVARRMAEDAGYPGFSSVAGDVRRLEGWNFEVIIGCTGDAAVRLFANSRACQYRIPYIDVSADGKRGKIQTVLPGGPCAECGMDRFRTRALDARPSAERPARKMRPDAGSAEALAEMVSEEALCIACGRQDLCARGVLYYDGKDGSISIIRMDIDPRCPNHGKEEVWKRTLKS